MADERLRRFCMTGATAGGAVIAAIVLGSVCGESSFWTGVMALVVGLTAGVAVLPFRSAEKGDRIWMAAVGAVVGLVVFAMVSAQPEWQAETNVVAGELDDLCVRVTAMGICHQRKMFGVFDFSDVPDDVVQEATLQVGQMSHEDKVAICDRVFGDRINSDGEQSASASSGMFRWWWYVLAVFVSVLPAARVGSDC